MVMIQPGGKDSSVLLGTTKTKKQKSVMKKEFPRMAKAVANQAVFAHTVLHCIYRIDAQLAQSQHVVARYSVLGHANLGEDKELDRNAAW